MVILSGCAKANPTLGFKTNGSLPNQAVDAYIIWLQIKRCWSGHFLQATLCNNCIVVTQHIVTIVQHFICIGGAHIDFLGYIYYVMSTSNDV